MEKGKIERKEVQKQSLLAEILNLINSVATLDTVATEEEFSKIIEEIRAKFKVLKELNLGDLDFDPIADLLKRERTNRGVIEKQREKRNELDFMLKVNQKLRVTPGNAQEFKDSLVVAMKLFMRYLGAKNFGVWTFSEKNKILYPFVNNTKKNQDKVALESGDRNISSALNAFLIPIESDKRNPKVYFGYNKDKEPEVLFPCYNTQGVFDSIVKFTFSNSQRKNEQQIQNQSQVLQKFFEEIIGGFRKNVDFVRELQNHALQDSLTGLANRKRYEEFMNALNLTETKRQLDKNAYLLMLDLDFFKRINDNYGHDAGDDVLKEVAKILKTNVRKTDLVARFGGEEFVIVLPNTNLENAKSTAEKLRKTIEETIFKYTNIHNFLKEEVNLTTSIGIASYDQTDTSCFDLQKRADHASYQAKKNGRNQVVVAGEFYNEKVKCMLKGSAHLLGNLIEKFALKLSAFLKNL